MNWDISAEVVSAIMLCIIMVYARKGNLLPTLKNLVFQLCLLITFLFITSNILSTILLKYYHEVPHVLNLIVLLVYFVCAPLIGYTFYVYTLANVFEKDRMALTRHAIIAVLPAVGYLLIILCNPFNHMLFTLTSTDGYQQGPLMPLTYIVFYIYVALIVLIVLIRRNDLDKMVRYILAVFPLLSCVVILYQYFYPRTILTGTAATSSLLIIYLYLQNKQMFTDSLTGLMNRQEFNKMIELKMKSKHSFIILVVSLKDFKFINDKFGHQIGDHILLEVCHYLRQLVPLTSLYRYSGDEFAIFCEGEEELNSYSNDIRNRMMNPWSIDQFELMVSYVLGGVYYPTVARNEEEIIKGLEFAVNQAKKFRMNDVCICSSSMLRKLQRDDEILSILKTCTVQNSFQVFFQPIYDVKEQRYNKAEALLRLPDNPLGFVSPEEFIPIAEENGLIVPITYQVLEKTCQFIKRLLDHQVDIVGVSVNFSIVQFLQEDLAEKVLKIIDSFQIPYHKIHIEVTESMLATNYETVVNFIQLMSKKGVEFLLDDFGTGYSTMSHVLTIPFHTIKFDKSLIWNAMLNEKAAIVVKKMIEAFVSIGEHVVAEGIETKEQADFISSCGGQYQQGYYYSKPVTPDEAFDTILTTSFAGEDSNGQ